MKNKAARKERKENGMRMNLKAKDYLSKYGIFIAFILLCVVMSIMAKGFFSVNNGLNILKQVSINAGAKFVVLDIPDHSDNRLFLSRFPNDPEGTHYGLPVVKVIDTLKAHAGELLYWTRSQRHFTPLGCRLVGDKLAEYIIEERLLDLSAE